MRRERIHLLACSRLSSSFRSTSRRVPLVLERHYQVANETRKFLKSLCPAGNKGRPPSRIMDNRRAPRASLLRRNKRAIRLETRISAFPPLFGPCVSLRPRVAPNKGNEGKRRIFAASKEHVSSNFSSHLLKFRKIVSYNFRVVSFFNRFQFLFAISVPFRRGKTTPPREIIGGRSWKWKLAGR